jgi:hypothetical protein
MPRKLRIEFEGAICHVMNRGDRREPIFYSWASRLPIEIIAGPERGGRYIKGSSRGQPKSAGKPIGRGGGGPAAGAGGAASHVTTFSPLPAVSCRVAA